MKTAEQAYMRSEVESAEPIKLVILLYNKVICELSALKQMFEAGTALGDNGMETNAASEKYRRSRDILTYLLDSLDPSAGEVTNKLAAMYYYSLEQILSSQMEKSGHYLDNVIPQLETIREGWVELEKTQQ